jgi:hypothetical protein
MVELKTLVKNGVKNKACSILDVYLSQDAWMDFESSDQTSLTKFSNAHPDFRSNGISQAILLLTNKCMYAKLEFQVPKS